MTDADLKIVEDVLIWVPEICGSGDIKDVAINCFGYDTLEGFIEDELDGNFHLSKKIKKFLARFGGTSLGFIYDRDSSGTLEQNISAYSAFIALSGDERSILIFMYNN